MFFKISNEIKISNVIKKKIIFKNVNKKELNLLKIFLKINIIKFIFKKKNKYIIILNLFKKNKLIFNIKNMYKPSILKNLKNKNIKNINKKNKLFLISSNKGIINNYEAEKIKIGGIIITYI